MYLEALLKRYREENGLKSQLEAAEKLGISPSLLSSAKVGQKPLADHWIVEIAEGAGVPAGEAVARYHEEREESPKVKNVWAELAKRAAAMAPKTAGTAAALMIGLHCKSLILLQNWIFW
ncbi:hypothetical protein [Gallaecimonas pentaromativorans]|uniref:HTH cro/C1-type domain-containing protein n=1 Tax=Gallaecimonas pentaromativorans TaxID=584787 RepID=A0A3N1PKV7_9GAMM|nr:hypothetical protein [Gallaecimonas pentaromativorans]ROQ27587.1 hypothetical protein EDC28_104238 [Gallaecimonas pentaromativorans]